MALHIILSYKMVVSSQLHTLATKPQRKTFPGTERTEGILDLNDFLETVKNSKYVPQ